MYLCTSKIKEWKQINYRNVDTMLSVQFIYDLYDQYNSEINWFRFKMFVFIIKIINYGHIHHKKIGKRYCII